VAVLRETLTRHGTTDPPAALVKALLINGAAELGGQYTPTEAGRSPNNNSGFGRVDLAGSVILPDDPAAGFGIGAPLDQDDDATVTIQIPSGRTLKITLVWTDPPGAALQNDLDLIVVAANGEERHGNVGASSRFDRVNNVEQVVWPIMPPGPATVTIRAFRITLFPQPFAYSWSLLP
jgi:serine protease AprX